MSTIISFMKENTEKYQYQKALNYVKSSINRLNNSTKCIKKLKNVPSNTQMPNGRSTAN